MILRSITEVRIFRNDIGAEYKGKIHEQVSFPEMMKAAKCDVEILQSGITDEERKEKMKRNAEILLNDSDNPNKDFLLCQTFNMTTEINTYLKHAFNVMHGDYDNSAKALVCYWTALTMAANNYGKDVVRQWLGASIMYEPMQICSRHILFKDVAGSNCTGNNIEQSLQQAEGNKRSKVKQVAA